MINIFFIHDKEAKQQGSQSSSGPPTISLSESAPDTAGLLEFALVKRPRSIMTPNAKTSTAPIVTATIITADARRRRP
eukprot:m.30255 g.30255  ORF g.30255 m.30255 type:complete len:78 (+) comp10589_c0_seq1:341-574(+)